MSLISALERLDKTSKHCLFVIDDNQCLLGALTDGDVRRYIISHGTSKGKVSEAYNQNCKWVSKQEIYRAKNLLETEDLTAIPALDEQGRVCDIVFSDSKLEKLSQTLGAPLPVVMMAGGVGSRLMPITSVIPKPLVPVNGLPIAERIINRFYEGGCSDFYLILNYKKGMIKAYFNDLNPAYNVTYIEEEKFFGTGGGLKLVEDYLSSTFILTNCDILIDVNLAELVKTHKEAGNTVTVVCSLKNYVIPYGTIEISEGGEIARMHEKPSIPSLINTGCYVVEPEVFNFINPNESIGFPDVITRCQEHGLKVGVYPISEGSWLDMGEPAELKRMSQMLESD